MAEPFTIYKLTILYMLDKAGFPLSNTQISNFFLEKEYTDYFRVQEVIGDLVNADLINFKSTHSNTQYTLTAAGKETLGFFKDKITDGIESDVKSFFTDNKLEFRQENSILADYYRTTDRKYAVRCQVRSESTTIIDLTLSVGTKEQAEGHLQQLEESERGCVRIPHGMLLQIDYFLVFLTEYPKLPSLSPKPKYSPCEYITRPVSLI